MNKTGRQYLPKLQNDRQVNRVKSEDRWWPQAEGGGWGRGEQAEHSGYLRSEVTLCDTLMVEYVLIDLSQLVARRAPRATPNVNYGLWVIKMCQYRLLHGTKAPLWRGMFIVGEAVHVWGCRRYEGNLLNFVPSPQFCCESKTVLKK